MIPVKLRNSLSISDLPARASNVDEKDTLNLLGGRRQTWQCYSRVFNRVVGSVTIWWGFRGADANWACYYWIPTCGNGGDCRARSPRG